MRLRASRIELLSENRALPLNVIIGALADE